MTIKLKAHGGTVIGGNVHDALVAVAKQHARTLMAAQADITDSSGGSAAAARTLDGYFTAFTNVADDGTSLAQEASTQEELVDIKDALEELAEKANALATLASTTTVTNNIGGTTANGTIDAIGVSATAASTGVQATEMEVIRLAVNDAIFTISEVINGVMTACGLAKLNYGTEFDAAILAGTVDFQSTIAALDMSDTGTAADPGVTAAQASAALASWRDDVATLAARVNAATAAVTALDVTVV